MGHRSLSRIDFDPREAKVVSGLARWMGLLGRFQILGATCLLLLLLAAVALVSTAELLEPATTAADQAPPLVSMGDVPRWSLALVVGAVVGFILIFLRGGMLLLAGAEDFENIGNGEGLDQHHLESAIHRLRGYFVLESLLMVGIALATYALTIATAP